MKLSVIVSLLSLLLLPVVGFAAFNDVALTEGSTFRTTVSGTTIDLTVTAGTIEKVDVTAGNLTVTLAAGSSVDLTSASKRTLNYSIGNATANFECKTSTSVLSLSL